MPSRDEDLVEQDGIRRFGPLFPTGSGQRLSPAVDVTLTSRSFADGHSCLDFETGRLYEYLEGLEDAAEKAHDRLHRMRWFIRHGIDLTADGGHDLHLWMIDNARWDGLDSEVRSEEPFQLGREAESADFYSDQIGTFLFTTREGSRGVLRSYPTKRHRQSKRFEYRLWNRDTIAPGAHTQPSPRDPGAWQPDKTVVLKAPGFGKECLCDLEIGKAHVLPASIFAPKPLPEIDELLRFGGILRNNPITAWARRRGIVLATHISRFASEASEDEDQALNNGQMAELTLLDARQTQVTQDAFKNLTPAHAREILARYPSPYRVASMSLPLDAGSPPATWLFETQTRLLGILDILKVGDGLASIEFRYKLALPGS